MFNPYIMFNGDCREAMEAYVEIFGGKILRMLTYAEMPPSEGFTIPDEIKDRVMHAQVELAGMLFMCSDSFRGVELGGNVSVHVGGDEATVQRIWDGLRKGAKVVHMELQASFFAPLHGTLQDRFGVNWIFTADGQ